MEINANEPIAPQIKAMRLAMGIALKDMAEQMGVKPSNLCAFENGTGAYAGSGAVTIQFAVKAAKAMGFQNINISFS